MTPLSPITKRPELHGPMGEGITESGTEGTCYLEQSQFRVKSVTGVGMAGHSRKPASKRRLGEPFPGTWPRGLFVGPLF